MSKIDYTIQIIEILEKAVSDLLVEDFKDFIDNIKIEIESYEEVSI